MAFVEGMAENAFRMKGERTRRSAKICLYGAIAWGVSAARNSSVVFARRAGIRIIFDLAIAPAPLVPPTSSSPPKAK